jgi:hypothetical protein
VARCARDCASSAIARARTSRSRPGWQTMPLLLPGLAAELVRLGVDLIVAYPSPAVAAARQATRTIPIVMLGAGDPAATGLGPKALPDPAATSPGTSSTNLRPRRQDARGGARHGSVAEADRGARKCHRSFYQVLPRAGAGARAGRCGWTCAS